jgi:UDP-glucose 4-epimerase
MTMANKSRASNKVIVLDSLVTGHRSAVPTGVELVAGDLRDPEATSRAVAAARPEAVLHFAALTLVGESVERPGDYFAANTVGGHNLLAAMRHAEVPRLVFSSTAAVYGLPAALPIREDAPTEPINPYGRSKLMVEQMLPWHGRAWGLRSACLRYFNVAGASGTRGEDHRPETHVIPAALQVLLGKRPHFSVFGTDYPTPDGTAIRDYVHVLDLVDAHLLALGRLDEPLGAVNLGTRDGFSVRQVIEAVERVTGRELPVELGPRRAGDPPALIADSTRAREVLGWSPRRSTLDEMVGSAWAWHQAHPDGYGDA